MSAAEAPLPLSVVRGVPFEGTSPEAAAAWEALCEAAGADTARTQSNTLRRTSQLFAKAVAAKRSAADADAFTRACDAVLAGLLSPDAAPSSVSCSAVTQFLAVAAAHIPAQSSAAVSARVQAFAAGGCAPVCALHALLEVPQTAAALPPAAAPAAISLAARALSDSVSAQQPSTCAMRAFVALAPRFPREFAQAFAAGADAALDGALRFLLRSRRHSKGFLSAAGVAFAAVVLARAIASSDGQRASVVADAVSDAGLTPLGRLSVVRGLCLGGFADAIGSQALLLDVTRTCLLDVVCTEAERAEDLFTLQLAARTLADTLHLARKHIESMGPRDQLAKLASKRVLGVVWKHLGNTVYAVFDGMQDVFSEARALYAAAATSPEDAAVFEHAIARRLLSLSWRSRGRYAPLMQQLNDGAVSAKDMLALSPSLVSELLNAISDRSIHTPARQLFSALLSSLARDSQLSDSFAQSIVSELARRSVEAEGHEGTWQCLVEEVISPLFAQMPSALPLVLGSVASLGLAVSEAPRMLLLLCALSEARKKQGTIPGAETTGALSAMALRCCGADIWTLAGRGLAHPDEPVFIAALELVCVSAKPSDVPTPHELNLLRAFLVSNSAHSSTNSRQRMISPLASFFERIRFAFTRNKKQSKEKQKKRQAVELPASTGEASSDELMAFLQWAGDEFIAMTYPGASQERVAFALTGYRALAAALRGSSALALRMPANAEHVEALVACLWRTLDRVRELALEILHDAERPLPGLSDANSVAGVIRWALRLVHSPRMHQSDAGGRLLSMILGAISGTTLRIHITQDPPHHVPAVVVTVGDSQRDASEAVFDVVRQLVALVRSHISVAKEDLLLASQRYPMHGLLTAIRYSISSITFPASASDSTRSAWRSLLSDVMSVANEVYNVVLPVVADLAPEGYNPAASGESAVPLIQAMPQPPQEQMSALEDFEEEAEDVASSAAGVNGPAGQLITVCSWLCVKETSFLLAAIHDFAPFPTGDNASDVVTLAQVRHSGDVFLQLLLSTRHKGAIEKAYEGFRSLCFRVLRSKSPAVNALATEWVEHTLAALDGSAAQQVTRRSAGIPYVLSAILSNDVTSSNSSSELLERAMNYMLELSSGSKGFSPQVHAFNIVASLVNQKYVSSHIDHFLDRVLVRILQAYTSQDWSVRNAATIAFNLVIKRRVRTASFYEFFAKFPTLHGYLQEHIGAMCNSSSGDLLQSSLFAVLTLLSRLHPSPVSEVDDSASESDLKPEPFIPFVRSCASQRTFRIREAAANALLPLVRPQNVLSVCLDIACTLPDAAPITNPNAVHGGIWQLEKLLDNALSSGTFSTVPDELCKALEPKLWLAVVPCAPIGVVMSRVLSHVQAHSSPTIEEFRGAALCACRASLELLLQRSASPLPMDSVCAELNTSICLEAAARSPERYIQATSETSDALLERTLCADQALYEVRVASLRSLLQLSKQQRYPGPFSANKLFALLLRLLFDEEHPRCLKRIMQLLPCAWNACSEHGESDLARIWTRAEALITEPALCLSATALLSFCVGKWPAFPPRWSVALDAIKSCCDGEKVVSERLSAVRCIVLALGNSALPTEALHELWLALCLLLQDDDIFVRQEAGSAVSKILKLGYTVSPPIALKLAKAELPKFSSIESAAGSSSSPASEQQEPMAVDATQQQQELLFEVEPNNFFSEDAVLWQLATAQKPLPFDEALERLERAARKTKATMTAAQQKRSGSGWTRLLAHEVEIFMPLYQACIEAVHAASASMAQDPQQQQQLVLVLATLQDVPLHPLCSQLLRTLANHCDVAHAVASSSLLPAIDATNFLVPLQTPRHTFEREQQAIMSIGIPIKVLHEAEGHVVTVELKSGELYRGKLALAEDNMNMQLSDVSFTARDGRVSQLEAIYLRGSKVRFMVLPDMLRNAPMFTQDPKAARGRGIGRGNRGVFRGGRAGRSVGARRPQQLQQPPPAPGGAAPRYPITK